MIKINSSGMFDLEGVMTFEELVTACGRAWVHSSPLITLTAGQSAHCTFKTPVDTDGTMLILPPTANKDGSVVLIELLEGVTVSGGQSYTPINKHRRRNHAWPGTQALQGGDGMPAITVTGGSVIAHGYVLGDAQGANTVTGSMNLSTSGLVLMANTVYSVKITAVDGAAKASMSIPFGFIPVSGF